jgi:hypothetical protein
MRSDMFKVIVERPRLVRGDWLGGGRESGFRQFLNSEERPQKVGMRAGHLNRKGLNENLAPLRRFLIGSAGRPWDKVRSEVLAQIDQRSTVQQHIMEHVDDYVLTEVVAKPRSDTQPGKRGVVFLYRPSYSRSGAMLLVQESRSPLFVDPRTGILRETHSQVHRKAAKLQSNADRETEHTKTIRVIDSTHQFRRFDDVWYEVVIAPIPGTRLWEWQRRHMKSDDQAKLEKVWCALEKRWLSRFNADTYVTTKRQLNSKEILKNKLNANG